MSELPQNIDCFNVIVGHIFAQTYAKFPIPAEIDELAIADALGVEKKKLWSIIGKVDRTGDLPSGDSLEGFINATLKWLRQENFIRGEGDFRVTNCVLTKEALTLMNKVPLGLQSKKTLGTHIIDAMKETGKTASDAAIGDLVGQVIGGFTKSFVS